MTVDRRSEIGGSDDDGLGPIEFLDTNTIVRYLTRDDEGMAIALRLSSRAIAASASAC